MSRRSLDEEFVAIEKRIEALADRCARLTVENRSLREQQDAMIEERSRLIEKNETARGKVEQMIVRLKALESGQ